MKAVRFVGAKKPLELHEVPLPEIGQGDVLVRVRAAGICHSDVHYRTGIAKMDRYPITLGHEVAGVIEAVGENVGTLHIGDRVSLHYLITCGTCDYCFTGHEQFCSQANMLGKDVDGGYAEYISVPAKNAVILPDAIPFEEGATLMCASATALHALLKSRMSEGNTVAIFGIGGLGISAVQLAIAMGATAVFAIDLNADKLALAESYGAIGINPIKTDPVQMIRKLSGGRGVDVVLEMIGLPITQNQAIRSASPMGRVVMVGLSDQPVLVDIYREILGKEIELIGSNDHNLHELSLLMQYASDGRLDTSRVVSRIVPLDAVAINEVLDSLERFDGGVRSVIVP